MNETDLSGEFLTQEEHAALEAQREAIELWGSASEPAVPLKIHSTPLTRETSNVELDAQIIRRDLANGRYKLRLFETFTGKPTAKRHLIKGVMAWGETSLWVAAPGGMKSALLASAAVAVARGDDWMGKRNKGAAGVVYFALERRDLVERRFDAHRQKLGLATGEALPIAVVDDLVDLTKRENVASVVDAVRRAEKCFGVPVGLIVFDTFAKMIAAGGLDEDKAAHQGLVWANLQLVKSAIPAHVAIIAHTGKDETRGVRGSNASVGDADLIVQISGETVRTATVTKANDAPEGELFSFLSEVHEFGSDEDGDPITVNIVGDAAPLVPTAPREPRLTANQKTMFGILHGAGHAGLHIEDWNAKAKDAGLGVKRRADLIDYRNALKSKGLIRQVVDHWYVDHS